MTLNIRTSRELDKATIEEIHVKAFGGDDGPEIVNLLNTLCKDITALPLLSLVAVVNGQIGGHILFSKAAIVGNVRPVAARIMAPLAVSPELQKTGLGGGLIKKGFELLKEVGVDLVFVLGYPDYYHRFGFTSAGTVGFNAPYPIPAKNADAWMVIALRSGIIGSFEGEVQCADALNRPEYWRE